MPDTNDALRCSEDAACITVQIVQRGETAVTVDRAEYGEYAKSGGLEFLLDTAAARLPLHTYVVGPDGAAFELGDASGADDDSAIHTHFGLSYANYLVLPRTLLQSMPGPWQSAFTHLIDQFHAAYRHIEQADVYQVTAAHEHIVNEMTEQQLKAAGIAVDWYGAPAGLDEQDLAEWQEAHETAPTYSCDGEELDSGYRVLLPAADPVPHYDRGRARIEPHLLSDRAPAGVTS